MSLFVIDASVAAKWFLPRENEALVPAALEILELYRNQKLKLVVPDVFWAEFANVFWKAVRQGRITKPEAEVALSVLMATKLPTISSLTLLSTAFSIATTHDRAVYDSLYVALAVIFKATLITAD